MAKVEGDVSPHGEMHNGEAQHATGGTIKRSSSPKAENTDDVMNGAANGNHAPVAAQKGETSSSDDEAPINSSRPKRQVQQTSSSSAVAYHSKASSSSSSASPPLLLASDDEELDAVASSSSSPMESSASLQNGHRPRAKEHSATPAYELTPVATSLPPKRKKKASAAVDHPQLVDHLPRADDEALGSFVRMGENWYANRHIGRSKANEQLVCECNYRPGRDDLVKACGHDIGCINRLCQIECLSSDCRCGDYCQNQRFQRRQYADVEIIKTEKKGFGLRAAAPIPADAFVYEYIGEVVEPDDFHARMRRYHDERIPHFYFMMLQKDEYLDATKKGGIARFINHSCNPNCNVTKWQVGKHMRMGIFAQRDIVKGEELTFNYNVDRYGNEAQPCYCGEANCVGQLGGKTQTDIGGMSNLYIEALGIVDEVERLQARGSRKQKSRILDEDFKPTLHPLEEDETSTVATAIRQASNNRAVLMKLLERIEMTNDVNVHKRFVRLHGFILMVGVMTEWKDDREILLSCLKILAKWPLIARNKVVDTGVEAIVEGLMQSEDGDIAALAGELISAWQKLNLEFRIARKEGGDEDALVESETEAHSRARRRRDGEDDDSQHIQARMDQALDAAQAPNDVSRALAQMVPRPLGKSSGHMMTPQRFGSFTRRAGGGGGEAVGTPDQVKQHGYFSTATPAGNGTPRQPTMSIEQIIRRANQSQAVEAARAQEAEAAAARLAAEDLLGGDAVGSGGAHRSSSISPSKKRKSSSSKFNGIGGASGGSSHHHHHHHHRNSTRDEKRHKTSSSSSSSSSSEYERAKKRLSSLIGEIVVRAMSKKKDQYPLNDKDSFKKYAKEATEVLVNKEVKRWTGGGGGGAKTTQPPTVPDKFSTEKKDKIKAFVNDFSDKVIARKKGGAGAGNGGRVRGEAEEAVATDGAVPSSTAASAPGMLTPGAAIDDIQRSA